MNISRIIIATLAITLFALLWNGFVHMVILRDANMALEGIARPASERSFFLSLLLTAAIASLFIVSYASFVRTKGVKAAVGFGAMFGLLAGLLVDLNQYLMYPVPGSLVLSWFLFGMIEFTIYGVIAALICPVDVRPSAFPKQPKE
jgi:hypothetical protein